MVHASDVAALPVRLGAAIRNSRLFHPEGVLAEGLLERVAPPDEGLPMQSCDVIGRISKGVGLPGAMADIAGLAWRIPPPQDLRSCMPWDVLLASTVGLSQRMNCPHVRRCPSNSEARFVKKGALSIATPSWSKA